MYTCFCSWQWKFTNCLLEWASASLVSKPLQYLFTLIHLYKKGFFDANKILKRYLRRNVYALMNMKMTRHIETFSADLQHKSHIRHAIFCYDNKLLTHFDFHCLSTSKQARASVMTPDVKLIRCRDMLAKRIEVLYWLVTVLLLEKGRNSLSIDLDPADLHSSVKLSSVQSCSRCPAGSSIYLSCTQT